jgi:DNA-binding NarL/FixJ family response regulator
VIVLSGQDDSANVVECLRAGAEDYLPKPYEFSVLEARVRASVDRKRMHDLERGFRARVARLTAAAEAVERQTYTSEMLASLAAERDELARLARVFDRMVNGLKSREERLQRRVHELRREMSAATDAGARGRAGSDSEPTHYTTGDTLARRYEILGTLGSGGMGTVYRARDTELGEQVALKVVRPEIIRSDQSIVERLKSEIRLARKISHPNVVRAHDLGEWNGTYFITMEYVEGITVADLLDRRGRLSVESTLAIGTQLAQALAVAHDAEIVHRDVKPANLLIDESGTLKVMDFGIAFHTQRSRQITLGGFVVGTPHYMAPEQLTGGVLGARTDLFAVGVVLYECLAGRPPFDGDTPISQMTQIMSASAVRLDELVAGVPPALAVLVHQLLEFEPQRRPESARALAARLAEIEPLPASDVPAIISDLELIQLQL